MKPFLILIFVLASAACGKAASEGKAAEEQFNMVQATRPTKDEECKLSREVADAYLRDRDAEQYRTWDIRADINCRSAALGL